VCFLGDKHTIYLLSLSISHFSSGYEGTALSEKQKHKSFIFSTEKEISECVQSSARGITAAINRKSATIMPSLVSIEATYRSAASKSESVIFALEGLLRSLQMQQESGPGTSSSEHLSKQIETATATLHDFLTTAREIQELSVKQTELFDKIEGFAVSKDESRRQEQSKADIKTALEENSKKSKAIEEKISQAAKFGSFKISDVSISSQTLQPHDYPTIFNIVSLPPQGQGELYSAFNRKAYVYCSCEYQCSTSLLSKDVPVPFWHPVQFGKNKSFFRHTVWQTKEFVHEVGPVLKLSYLALKAAASVHDLKIPDLQQLYPEELRMIGVDTVASADKDRALTVYANECGIDVTGVFKEENLGEDLISELKENAVSLALMRPENLDTSALQVLRTLFPEVCFGFSYVVLIIFCRSRDKSGPCASTPSPSPVHTARLERSCGCATSMVEKSRIGTESPSRPRSTLKTRLHERRALQSSL
jgi:hypothetical protein